ncbi:hypothetical protein BFU36_11925 [Sulfolobus sp. A20]|nr:hypothetical protein BFU36_11925 [Sulfolobus sp. A20]TRM74669.1 hypothetical protein DJ523_04360 [Sulfolobus sp. E5]TRM78488.1 hypothetical protein DJ528_04720 [Sulfolobus sp. B5]TRM84790.1 hypothetical protein DJ522_03375 [Sulfolobus sp. F3]TRM85678.1 hypothetical protein DJ521_07350 [Sulfolobus sp. E3]TRM87008.1 hypothetical protein DJ529_09785 [Sulfolobus sp. C3]TRM97738.1 hypothetical protein DMP16_01445 [Sulfolobus sp. B1]TRN02207.1 hypothetical protein DJ527_04235 [Sulfolobus sp. F1
MQSVNIKKDLEDLSKIYELSKRNKEFAYVFYYLIFINKKWSYDIFCEDNKRLEVIADSLKILRNPFLPY